ncbi:1,4-beta-glucanase [Nocardia sp. ET3-3]|uniref:Glucanase n=1 Tax=Nocardia terrae TaxID=2675851 RepID=A0A7K1UUV9_9NOCA|nr:glycoside hydrolase family 6 protein [Nocardia terrae]MVU78157.1 1,4-beta-glucanase [Nocardia terrae]
MRGKGIVGLLLLAFLFAVPDPPAAQGNPFDGYALYVDPQSQAAVAAREPGQEPLRAIAVEPTARWFDSATPPEQLTTAVDDYLTAAGPALTVLVAYAIPHRDCGNVPGGGVSDADAYRRWIDHFAAGIGRRHTVVIIEPDALANATCLTPEQSAERIRLLAYAVDRFTSEPRVAVYVDGGNSNWLPAEELARRLRAVHIERARGFTLNVSNFHRTDDERAYGDQVTARLGFGHYLVDTSRNGAGPPPDGPRSWCNPWQRGLGLPPTTITNTPHADAYLWIKRPGESDGPCAPGQPTAGVWWPAYALDLIQHREIPN